MRCTSPGKDDTNWGGTGYQWRCALKYIYNVHIVCREIHIIIIMFFIRLHNHDRHCYVLIEHHTLFKREYVQRKV